MTTTTSPAQEESFAATLLRVVRRRVWLFLACLLLVPGAALAYSLVKTPEYEATASLLFREQGLDDRLLGTTLITPVQDPTREAATNAALVSLGEVSERTSRRFPGLTPKEISEKVQVRPRTDADVVDVIATDPSRSFAVRLANTYAQEYVAFRRDADRSQIFQVRNLLQRELAALPNTPSGAEQRSNLVKRIDQLQVLASLQTGNAELVQPARLPTVPASPKPRRNVAAGVVVGLLLGLALTLLLDRLDRRLHDPQEASAIFGRPILGVVPESRSVERVRDRPLPAADAEAFRMLRASLRYFNVNREIRSVLVTSAAPGDGKSTVAWHLAATAASAGSRILLIEADLRNPSLARFAPDAAGGPGLSAFLAGYAGIEDVTHQVAVPRPGRNGSGAETGLLDVILAGERPPNPTDLIESERMRQLIEETQLDYDVVIIDTPPTSVVSDAIPLVSDVSGVIVVTRLGKNTRDVATNLRDQLRNLEAPVLGVVVNGMPANAVSYYGYGEPG